ncbi:hypothetical protein RND81_02G070100 [Saponaria officinalis]|uniref:TF-B3 domain-containing protein n=1 Tax=Saponaria officinalis TaxID=3572 RepID=A0AAW1MJZ2_SAPOF
MGLSYEETRQKRVEENKKRLDELNLLHLSLSLNNLSPKSSPMKKVGKPKTVEKKMVAVRRSARVASNPAPVYVEVGLPRIYSPRKSYGVARRDLSDRVYATEEERAYTIDEAEKLESKLKEEGFPTLIRPMLPSHTSGGFWLGVPSDFCRSSMPRDDGVVTLVDEEGEEFPTVYLARKKGLSGGWKGFAQSHELVDGDAVIFQRIKPSVLKVYIIRASGLETSED